MSDVMMPINIKVDNKQAKSFAESTCPKSRIRGTIDLREGWVQDLKGKGGCSVEYVSTEYNVADILTKCMREGRHCKLLKMLQGKAQVEADE